MRSLLIKIFIILPLILIADYTLLTIPGYSTCLFGFGDDFYCGPFCVTGKILLLLSILFFGYLVYPDIVKLARHVKNAPAKEKA